MVYQQPFNSNEFIHTVNQQLKYYHEQITKLQTTIQELSKTVNELKMEKPTTIQYKFDQLKIERLEGTLNIGLKPDGVSDQIEDFAVQNQGLHVDHERYSMAENSDSETDRDLQKHILVEIQNNIDHYFNESIYNDLLTIENKYNQNLDDAYRQFIINDIRRQIPSRVEYYLHVYSDRSPNQDTVIEQVLDKIHKDIHQALEMFIQQLPNN